MKILLSLLIFITGLNTVHGQQYVPNDAKSDIKFTIKNFGINTPGSLKGLKGAITFNPSNLSGSSFNITVDVNTINTGIESRDSHIKKEEYFNIEKYPTINFISTDIKKELNGYIVAGYLTIKGITKAISFPFTVANQDNGLIFSGEFSIIRKDFGVGGNSAVLGNNVDIALKVFATKQ